ncbi:hypothetical protein BDW66DRAFT_77416 [Aspergillus desertorum]
MESSAVATRLACLDCRPPELRWLSGRAAAQDSSLCSRSVNQELGWRIVNYSIFGSSRLDASEKVAFLGEHLEGQEVEDDGKTSARGPSKDPSGRYQSSDTVSALPTPKKCPVADGGLSGMRPLLPLRTKRRMILHSPAVNLCSRQERHECRSKFLRLLW